MQRVPKGFVVTLGISAALCVAALFLSLKQPAPSAATAAGMPESCVRYGRVECCYKSE